MASWMLMLLTCYMPAEGVCTVLEFTASWCQPCQQMAPTLQRLANEGWEIRQVDTDRHPQLVNQFKVSNLPTLVILSGNKEVDRVVGVTRYEEINKRISRAAARSGYRPSADGTIASSVSSPVEPQDQQIAAPQPIVRGQSPMRAVPKLISGAASMAKEISNTAVGLAGQDAISRARDATVRIRVDEGNTTAHGTGTIVDAHGSQALILTCGHLFRDMQPQSQLSVDLFAGTPREQRVPAQLVDFSIEDEDIGLITIQLPVEISPVQILPRQESVAPGQAVFSFGCDHGQDPSLREAAVTHVNRYLGAANVEISGAPAVGRSGGGLFDRSGRLIGVCNAANEPENEGIYAGPEVFYRQLAKLNLQHLFEASQNPVDQKIEMHHTPASQTQNASNIALAPSSGDSQLSWPDQSLPEQTPGSSNSLQGGAAPRSMPPTTTAPVARQLIVIVKSGDGQDRVVTIDQPTPELVSQIRNQSAGAW